LHGAPRRDARPVPRRAIRNAVVAGLLASGSWHRPPSRPQSVASGRRSPGTVAGTASIARLSTARRIPSGPSRAPQRRGFYQRPGRVAGRVQDSGEQKATPSLIQPLAMMGRKVSARGHCGLQDLAPELTLT
jgi:hypothetical protein